MLREDKGRLRTSSGCKITYCATHGTRHSKMFVGIYLQEKYIQGLFSRKTSSRLKTNSKLTKFIKEKSVLNFVDEKIQGNIRV